MSNQASIRGIFAELASLLSDAGREMAIYTLVIGGLTAVGVLAGWTESVAGSFSYGFSFEEGGTIAGAMFEAALAIFSVVATYVLLTRFLAIRGRLHAGNRFWQYLGMAILSMIAVVFGLVLLIIPGIILLVRWSAASGFVIGAGDGIVRSLGLSWDSTQGQGWAIFFSALILGIGFMFAGAVIGATIGLASGQAASLVSAFAEAAAGGIFAALGIAIYCLVHDDIREVAEVFE